MEFKLNNIIEEIKAYMRKNGGTYQQWYVGIASKPKERLFNDHNVRQSGDAWIHSDAGSANAAREIEKYFVNQLGTDGGPGGGDQTTRHVYAYKKAYHTKP